jgi:hypothetical protein
MNERWKDEFLNMLKAGKQPEYAARASAGLPLHKVHEARESDPEFAQKWDALFEDEDYGDGFTATRILSPAALEALLWSQCTDDEAAAYFGLSTEQLMARIKSNKKLETVYRTARLGGVAALKRAQFELGLTGNAPILTHLGKNYAGQADKVEVNQKVEHVVDTKDLARKLMFIMAQAGEDALPAIDAEESLALPVYEGLPVEDES